MQIQGKIHEVGEVQQVTDKFTKRDAVIEVSDGKYSEYIKVEATQKNVAIFDKVNTGDEVTVDINLRGRPYTNKGGVTTYFNSIVAWRVTKGSDQPNQDKLVPLSDSDDSEDLPF